MIVLSYVRKQKFLYMCPEVSFFHLHCLSSQIMKFEIPLVTCEVVLWRVQRVGGSHLCFLPFSVMLEDPGGSSTTDSRQVLQSYLEFREVQLDQGH